MTEASLPDESLALPLGPSFNKRELLSMIALLIAAALLGFWLGKGQSSAPGEDSAEVGFARDMMMHHAQAVDMATILRDRTADPEMRQLALDIMLTQQAQIGQMQGWLTVWGYPIASTDPAMAWMGMPTIGIMPGMATPQELNQLRNLEGVEADGVFLQLMILHHRGGVLMGQAALERVFRPEVYALAKSIIDAQASEITAMQGLLQRKGLPTVPDGSADMNHETMSP